MHRRRSALVALASCTLVAGLLVPIGATAAAPTATAAATAVPRVAVKDLAMAAFGVAQKLYKCESIAEKGLECLKDPTIKDVLKKLDAIEAQIAANQVQTMKALDQLQRASDTQDLNKAVRDLDPIEAHILEAAAAWDALSTCAEKASTKGATCKGYNGGSTAAVPVAEGMRVSRKFFLGQMAKIDISIEQAAQRFAGTRSISGTDGLLHALWKAAKREQDRRSTPEGKTIKDPAKPPVVVTRSLVLTFLPTMTYYRDLLYLFGALRPAAMALKQKTDEAESEAKLADKRIFDPSSRWTVAGGFDFYRIPDLPVGTIAYVGKDGKLYKVMQGDTKGQRLRREVVQELGDRIAAYGYSADRMAADPQLLPYKGEWGVLEKVLHRTYKEYSGRYAICASSASIRPCDPKLDGAYTETFEIGHPGAVGSKDSQGNAVIERWVPMRILNNASTWQRLIDQERATQYGSCKLIGEPPYGVHNVKFLQTFRRLMEGHYADFTWETVRYGYAVQINVTPKCVGPGIYVRPGGPAYSVVDRGTPPGVLTTNMP
jgi:hypothetical protein